MQGFQEQVRHWPEQPLHAAAHWVRSLPASAAVADFGCGTAQLAAQVAQQVQSLDLVAAAPGVVACDMAHTPLGELYPVARASWPELCLQPPR